MENRMELPQKKVENRQPKAPFHIDVSCHQVVFDPTISKPIGQET
jgi:hypothetical protein